ncbi:MAG: ABC transporter permease [Bacteroidales bacterium]|nr:ABC transporter permease [Bacteroidales bacterium]
MKSYLIFLSRNKLYTFIEAFGLAFALGFVVLLVSYAKTEFSVGKNLQNADKVYALGSGKFYGLTLDTPVEFFPSFPEIDAWTRIANGNEQDVVIGENYYRATSAYIDSTFFQMFDYELRGCDQRQVLTNDHDVIVSEAFARKAFAGEDAIGKQLKVRDDIYTVCGVLEDFGRRDLFVENDLFFSIKRAYDLYRSMDNFGNTMTFLTLKPGTDPQTLADKLLDKYVEYWGEFYARDGSRGAAMWGSSLTRFDKIYFDEAHESYSKVKKGNRTLVEVLLLVALILLVSACLNYVNLTVALTGKRAKEMTMRRVLGEQTRGVLFRYFSEAFLFTAACFLLGYFVAYLFKPLFEEWLSTSIPLIPDFQMVFWSVIALLLLSLISSLLPALLVLQFKPLDVVKGAFQFRSKMLFGRVFIVVQNMISMVLIAVAMTMSSQLNHLLSLPLGYRPNNLIAVSAFDLGFTFEIQDILRQRLLALPQVDAVGLAANLPYRTSFNGLHDGEGNTSWINYTSMDTTTFRLLGFKIVEQFAAPTDSMCWVDRETQSRYNISAEHPSIETRDKETNSKKVRYRICGIVENYRSGMGNYVPRFEDSHNVIQLLGADGYYWSQLVKVRGDKDEALAAVRKTCKDVMRQLKGYSQELNCSYYDESMRDALTQERHTMQFVLCFMFLSILISALGLFAMSVNYSEQHSKSIAIGKIMGASVRESVWKLSRRFILLSLVAIVLAIPLCVKAMNYYLQDFYNRIDFPWLVILLSAIITMLVVILSILGQAIRIATRNPIEGIKTE